MEILLLKGKRKRPLILGVNSYPEAAEQIRRPWGCKGDAGREGSFSSRAHQVYRECLEGTVLIFTLAMLFIPPTPVSTANWLQIDSYIHKQVYKCCAAFPLKLDPVVQTLAQENIP